MAGQHLHYSSRSPRACGQEDVSGSESWARGWGYLEELHEDLGKRWACQEGVGDRTT